MPIKTILSDGVVENVRFTVEDSIHAINLVFYGIDQVNPLDGAQLPAISFQRSLEVLGHLWTKVHAKPGLLNTPRMAIAPVYFIPVDDKVSGYEVVSKFIPFAVNGQTSSDFLFQINNPALKDLPNGKKYTLNTLVQLSVAIISSFAVGLSGPGIPAFLPKEVYRARFQFDVNNAPASVLEAAEADVIYRDSVANIGRILVEGISL